MQLISDTERNDQDSCPSLYVSELQWLMTSLIPHQWVTQSLQDIVAHGPDPHPGMASTNPLDAIFSSELSKEERMLR